MLQCDLQVGFRQPTLSLLQARQRSNPSQLSNDSFAAYQHVYPMGKHASNLCPQFNTLVDLKFMCIKMAKNYGSIHQLCRTVAVGLVNDFSRSPSGWASAPAHIGQLVCSCLPFSRLTISISQRTAPMIINVLQIENMHNITCTKHALLFIGSGLTEHI